MVLNDACPRNHEGAPLPIGREPFLGRFAHYGIERGSAMSHQDRCNGQAYRVFLTMSIFAAIGFAVAVSTASAQGLRETDVSVGYLNLGGSMQGGNVQLTAPITERWSVVGEFDASSGRDCSGCEPDYRDVAGLGGVRYVWRPSVRLTPFWQVLAGGLRSTAGDYYVDPAATSAAAYSKDSRSTIWPFSRAGASRQWSPRGWGSEPRPMSCSPYPIRVNGKVCRSSLEWRLVR